MTVYAGLDLHATNTYVAMIDQENNVLYKQRHRNELPSILSALDPFKEDLKGVVVESTFNWYWPGGRPHGRGIPGAPCQSSVQVSVS
jgi:transposase